MSISHGQALLALCKQATAQVFLAAPFIKAGVLKKLLQAIPAASEVTIVTRWIAKEVAQGVCDLEIFDLAIERPRTRLLLHPCIHAKYYRVDSRCLIGSANLTATALGWCAVPNIEILLEVSPFQHELPKFEEMLIQQSITATEKIKDSIARLVEDIKNRSSTIFYDNQNEAIESSPNSTWLPTCVCPENLFKIYSGADTSSLLTSSLIAGQTDLSFLMIAPGLLEDEFFRYIATILDQTPLVREISFLSGTSAVTSETATALISLAIKEIQTPAYDPETYWHILKKWIIYFFPNRYRVRAIGEVLEQARELN
ncbi:phospholipase D family protein [Azonexus sp.]|uniref:phospholipase D family protein n=1 Tax=Azonexus sp. TaxID=1872668 RepID=UPI0027BAE4C0|nr:phospholipase D family protein [Azonexus sp.]